MCLFGTLWGWSARTPLTTSETEPWPRWMPAIEWLTSPRSSGTTHPRFAAGSGNGGAPGPADLGPDPAAPG